MRSRRMAVVCGFMLCIASVREIRAVGTHAGQKALWWSGGGTTTASQPYIADGGDPPPRPPKNPADGGDPPPRPPHA